MSKKKRIKSFKTYILVLIFITVPFLHMYKARSQPPKEFPAGYIDSPYVLQDASAIYFLHSPSPVNKFGNPSASPASITLPDHQGAGTNFWFNTDIYVSYRNTDGTYSRPENLGDNVNSKYLECCVWVNKEQTKIIFSRDSWEPDKNLTGNYVATRKLKNDPWGKAVRLNGSVGQYLIKNGRGIHDLHLGETTNNLYGWSETEHGKLFHITKKEPFANISQSKWNTPEEIEISTPKGFKNSQPWLNKEETLMLFNRWTGADRELWATMRDSIFSAWGSPFKIEIKGFEDKYGNSVWGEPSFTDDGIMFFTRFDTSKKNWDAELLYAPQNEDGSYGPPIKIQFVSLKH